MTTAGNGTDLLLASTFEDFLTVLAAKGKEKDDPSLDASARCETKLKNFMAQAGEPITWVEGRELWNNMGKTNNGKLPDLDDTLRELLCLETTSSTSRDEETIEEVPSEDTNVKITLEDLLDTHLSAPTGDNDAPTKYSKNAMVSIAQGIKATYNIRSSSDKSELKFVLISLTFLWTVVIFLGVAGHLFPDNEKIGQFTWEVFAEAIILFLVELVWECFLSWIVLRYNIKINYTRKLGNLLKVPKYFAADLLPFYTSTSLSLVTSLTVSQTLFCIMFYRGMREKFPFCAYLFLSQDRREDRPDTLTFQVTEDIMRFAVYFPFKILVANRVGFPAIVFIPIAVNNIGDGLAEPVGVAFGRHKYTTTALYYKGKFWNGKFTRSLEGSFCVYITTVIVVALNYVTFTTPLRFWLTVAILPFLMAIAEAKAPHTNDGPFLALIGCSFLSMVFLL